MANKSAILSVKIVTDATKGAKGLKKYETGLQKFEKGAKRAAKPAAAVFAAGLLAAKGLVAAGEAAGTSNARIENATAGIASYGDKHAAVASRIIDNAEKMAMKTGIDQNAIKQGQATLLKFNDVAKSAEDMGGTFDRATAAAADLSASGLGSMERVSLTLGRSLEQPSKGLSRLSRLGVTFTQVEEDKIKALDESGQKLQAQEMIMRKVEEAAGGTAEATANASDKMKVGWSLATEALGTALMPAFEKFVAIALVASQWAQEHTGLIIAVVTVVMALATAILLVNGAFMAMRAAIVVATAVQWLWNAAMTANPIGIIIVAIAALVAGLVWFFTQTQVGQAAWAAFTSFMTTSAQAVAAFVSAAWQLIKAQFMAVVNIVRNLWNGAMSFLSSSASSKIGAIVGFFGRISGAVKSAIGWVRRLFSFSPPAWLGKAASAVGNLFGSGYMRPEYDVPDDGRPFFMTAAEPLLAMPTRPSSAAAGAMAAPVVNNYSFDLSGMVGDKRGLAKEIRSMLEDLDRNGGRKIRGLG